MTHRRRRMIELLAMVLAGAATATALLVADRTDQRAGAPAPTLTTGPAATSAGTGPPSGAAATPTSTGRPPTTRPPPAATTARRTTTTRPAQPPFPPGLAGRDVERLPTPRKIVALTFDGGANADALPSILGTLRREGVPATFFLTGAFAQEFGASSAAIAAAGHRLGNHSVSHPHFPALSDQSIRTELNGAETAIHNATGRDARPLFRFPFGDRDQRTMAVVNGAGYVAVRWTVDSLGWKGTSGGMSAAAVTERVLAALQPGEIVLMHLGSHPDDHSTLDADALPSVIARIRAAGYGFVTLDALLG